jgi:DNA-binding transcriptional MerR regulator
MKYGKERNVKLYYSISEVCDMTGLEKHVLRYWENEFTQLKPKKNRAGNRIYRAREIELINIIRELLHIEKFTIDGARQQLLIRGFRPTGNLDTQALKAYSQEIQKAREQKQMDLAPDSMPSQIDAPIESQIIPDLTQKKKMLYYGIKDVLSILGRSA